MNDLPPAPPPTGEPAEPGATPSTPPPAAAPPPYTAGTPYAPPLSAAAATPPTTPPWMGARAAQGAPPPAGPGWAPIAPEANPPAGAPPDYKTAGTFLLIGSITTLVFNAIAVLLLIWICIGVCWLPLLGVALWALVCGAQAMNGTRVRNVRLANALALVAAVLCADVIGIVMQILALVWLSKPDVARWIDEPA